VAVEYFYLYFALQKEQSSISMLGALFKQAMGGLGEVLRKIAQAHEN